MAIFETIASQMLSFAILLAAGAIAGKLGLIKERSLVDTINLVFKMLLPIMMFYLIYAGATQTVMIAHTPMIAFAVAFYGVNIALICALSKLLRLSGMRERLFKLLFVFGNTGFIGLPLLCAVFPESGIVDLAFFTLIDQVVFWTYGVHLASGERFRLTSIKGAVNPNVLMLVLALTFAMLGIRLPSVIEQPVSALASVANPLCMLCMGAMFVFADYKQALRHTELYVGVAVKMLLLPLAIGAIAKIAATQQSMLGSLVILSAMPTTTLVPLCVAKYGQEGSAASAQTVATIMMSVISLPLVSFILGL